MLKFKDITVTDALFFFWLVTEFAFLHTFIAQLGLLAFCGVIAFRTLVKNKIVFDRCFFWYILFAAICVWNIYMGFSISPALSKEFISTLALNFVFIYCAFMYLRERSFESVCSIFEIASLVIAALLVLQNISMTGTLLFREEGGINANSAAIMSAFVICFMIFAGHTSPRHIAVIAVLSIFIVLSGTRKALLTVGLVLVCYFFMIKPSKIFRNACIGALILFALYFLIMNVPFLYDNIGVRFEEFFVYLEGGKGDGSTETRNDYIKIGMMYIKDNPIFGHGVNCFQTLPGAFGTYSHNNYIELLFSVGIFGTLAYYMMYISVLLRGVFGALRTRSKHAIIAIAIIITCFITDYAQVVYYDRNSLIFIVLALSLVINKGNDYEQDPQGSQKPVQAVR